MTMDAIAGTMEDTLYIGGEWQHASGEPIDDLNPTNERLLASPRSATEPEVETALSAARSAFHDWSELPAPKRGAHLRKIADVIEDNADELARLLVLECGKPISQARDEVDTAVSNVRFVAEWDRRIEGEIVPSDNAGEEIHLQRVPYGVVAAICPWNFPVELFFRKLAPALLTGNTAVIKPSEVTPLSSIELMRLIDEQTDLPPGVINLVTGGRETGRALVRSPLTSLVAMTGHQITGKQIAAEAAANLTRVSIELGGKAPAIVWRDADLDQAVEAITTARHYFSGQVCTCAERVFVHESLMDEFVARYSDSVRALRVGDPATDPDVGPLVNAAQREKNERAVESATTAGAQVVVGGERPRGDGFGAGFWFSPTVLVDVQPDMAVMRDETFGPVTPIMAITSLEEALEFANDSRYGLSAYLFTSDYRTAMRATRELGFGEIYINRSLGEAIQGFHTGHKESGVGGEDGKHGVLKYTQLKTVYHNFA
jgi:lactaldehyde dehydrogenase/glycolaldehyde dehydrogenase